MVVANGKAGFLLFGCLPILTQKHGKPQSFLFRLPSQSERARPSFPPVTTTVDFFSRPEKAVIVVKQPTEHMWYDPRRFDILSTIPSINHPLFASFTSTRSTSVGCSPLELCKANVSVQAVAHILIRRKIPLIFRTTVQCHQCALVFPRHQGRLIWPSPSAIFREKSLQSDEFSVALQLTVYQYVTFLKIKGEVLEGER